MSDPYPTVKLLAPPATDEPRPFETFFTRGDVFGTQLLIDGDITHVEVKVGVGSIFLRVPSDCVEVIS